MSFFNAHIGAGEQRRGKANECRQRNQKDIERIDEELLMSEEHWAVSNDTHDKQRRGDQRGQAHPGIEFGCESTCAEQCQQSGSQQGQA